MAEETKEAAVIVPNAMVGSYLINGGLCFVILVTYCFLLVDYEEVLSSPAGLLGVPFVQVFINATDSVAGGVTLLALMAVVQILGCCNWMASNARQIFAFARDGGVPFHKWVAKVDTAGTYPVNAILIVWAGVCLLPLIYLGSTVAFYALTSLQLMALIFTYIISLNAILWRRIFKPGTLPSSPWTLGPLAIPINIIGWLYCFYQLIFLPWPAFVPVTAENFNWASVMFVGVMALAALYYFTWGKKLYKGPVVLIRPRGE
jgi:amino acid transporter